MSTITLPNIRVSSDLEIRLKLKDGGVAIDWSTLTNIKASIYSDRQRSLAGRCDIEIDEEDSTILVCRYSANKPQYPGVNRVIVCCTYDGETKTYDKPAFTFVRWTDDQAGQAITIDDPDIDVEISVQDVSSSILQEAVEAAFSAADRADEAAAAAEHMVDIHTGPAGADGKSAYEIAVEEGYVGTEEEWIASLHGTDGTDGTDGKSAYEIAVEEGFVGTEEQWLASLKGEQGNPGSSQDYPFELVNNEETNDATKAHTAAGAKRLNDKIGQLEAIVHNLSGKFYEPVTSSSLLPEGDEKGYTFVGATTPFAIWYFDGTTWSDTGMVVTAIEGKPGVGLDDVTTPTPADGTVVMHLSNGNTVTLNLNHNHPQYAKVVVCEDLAEYNAISQKDSMTFYLIPEVAMYLGSTLILEQNSTPLPYTPVDYIETDGDAYIDTGIIGAPVKSAEMKVLPAGGASYTILGSRGSTTDGEAKKFQMFRIIYYSADSIYVVGYGYYYSVAGASNPSVTDSVTNETPFIVKGSFKNGAQSVSVKEEGESSFRSNSTTYTKTITSSLNMYIFAANENGTAGNKATSGTRVYYCKIYSDDSYSTLLFNGVPCYYNNEYGLWDKVSNTFFGAVSGSGTITGPSIS